MIRLEELFENDSETRDALSTNHISNFNTGMLHRILFTSLVNYVQNIRM